MQNKSTSVILGIIIVILIIIGVAFASKNKAPSGVVQPTESAFPAGVTTTPQITFPTGTTTATTTLKTYTLSEVAAHKTQSDCWTTINGGVYNLTPFITQHPGGAANIMKVCGIDGSALFGGKHGTSTKPNAALAKLKIGVLAQ